MPHFKIIALTFLVLVANVVLSQNNTTSIEANPFCIGVTYTSAANSQSASLLEPGNEYNCLSSSPNPSWYFLKCSSSGNIELELSAPQDIDFIIYGPFNNYSNMLNACGSLNNVVDCSYSATNMETPSIPNMSNGEYYLLLVTNYANSVQEISLSQTAGTGSLDCTVYNEGGTHLIFGETYYDENNNGIFDGIDFGIAGVEIGVDPLSQIAYSNYAGDFYFFNQTPDSVYYTVDASLADFDLTSSPSTYSFGLDTNIAISDTLRFGFYPDTLYYSTSADIILNMVSCINNNSMWVNIQNDGTLPSAGTIEIELDPEIYFYNSSYPIDSQSGNTITFSYDSLYLFQNLNFQINTFPDDSLTVGDTIKTILNFETFDTLGVSLGMQTDTICSPVLCSYDPNFKESLPNGGPNSEIIQPVDSLEYVIHFQNTGTATAVNVVIEDTIHNNLDLSSFKFLSSSHNVNIEIDTNRLIKFAFNDINLPDSNSNEPESHGYIKFRMNLVENLLPHENITNDVAIFFDNNLPIYTNTVLNIIDCYIKPDLANTTVDDGTINTNLSDVNLSYEWFLDGNLIDGANDSWYEFTNNGDYSVVVTNEYGCTSTFSHSTSLNLAENGIFIQVSPNPFNNELLILNSNKESLNIKVINVEGKIVFEQEHTSQNKIKIDSQSLTKGIYFIEISSEGSEIVRQKLIKN